MQTRPIETKDYPLMREILYEAVFVAPGEPPYSKDILDLPEIDRYIAPWNDAKDFGFLMLDNNECIGAAWCKWFPEDNKGYGYVDKQTPELSIALKAPYRNKGLGKKMMLQLMQTAADRGHKRISLSVDKRNPSVRLYKRLGFAIFEENEMDFIMIKDLSPLT